MTTDKNKIVDRPIQYVCFIDFRHSLPQGDPAMENDARIDNVTGKGLFSPMGFKRLIRDYLSEVLGQPIFVGKNACFEVQVEKALDAPEDAKLIEHFRGKKSSSGANKDMEENLISEPSDEEGAEEVPEKKTRGKGRRSSKSKDVNETKSDSSTVYDLDRQVYWRLSERFADVAMFGQAVTVLSGTHRGPIQVCWGETVDPIISSRVDVTRCAVVDKKEMESKNGRNQTMGSVPKINYGLYRFHIYINPNDAKRTRFTEHHLEMFEAAMLSMMDTGRSSLRSQGCVQKIFKFEHQISSDVQALKVRPDDRLLNLVKVQQVNPNADLPPQSFEDYEVMVPTWFESAEMEYGIKISQLVPNLPETPSNVHTYLMTDKGLVKQTPSGNLEKEARTTKDF